MTNRWLYLIVMLPDGRLLLQKSEASRSSVIFSNRWRATVLGNNMYKCQSDENTIFNIFYTLTSYRISKQKVDFLKLGDYTYCGENMQVFLVVINDNMQLRVDNGILIKPVTLKTLRQEIHSTEPGSLYTLDTMKVFKIPEIVFNVQLAEAEKEALRS